MPRERRLLFRNRLFLQTVILRIFIFYVAITFHSVPHSRTMIRPLFGWFLSVNPDYGYAFGSLKAIFLLLIWVYYTFAAVLLGAEILAALRRQRTRLADEALACGPFRRTKKMLREFLRARRPKRRAAAPPRARRSRAAAVPAPARAPAAGRRRRPRWRG